MSEYEVLREDMAGLGEAIGGYQSVVTSHLLEQSRQIDKLWKDNAELRDDLHALANRVETLTRARLTEPAEVAERMIFVCRLNRGCNVSRPHIHADDGAVIYVQDEATADDQLRQRAAMRDAANVRRMAREYE